MHLWKARLHVELLEHSVHVTRGATILQPNKTRDGAALYWGKILTEQHTFIFTDQMANLFNMECLSYIKLLAQGRIGLVMH